MAATIKYSLSPKLCHFNHPIIYSRRLFVVYSSPGTDSGFFTQSNSKQRGVVPPPAHYQICLNLKTMTPAKIVRCVFSGTQSAIQPAAKHKRKCITGMQTHFKNRFLGTFPKPTELPGSFNPVDPKLFSMRRL